VRLVARREGVVLDEPRVPRVSPQRPRVSALDRHEVAHGGDLRRILAVDADPAAQQIHVVRVTVDGYAYRTVTSLTWKSRLVLLRQSMRLQPLR
jgi:hypothetical protein